MCASYDTMDRIFVKTVVPQQTLGNLWVNMFHITISSISYFQDVCSGTVSIAWKCCVDQYFLSYAIGEYRFTASATHLQSNEFKYIYHRNLAFLGTCQKCFLWIYSHCFIGLLVLLIGVWTAMLSYTEQNHYPQHREL